MSDKTSWSVSAIVFHWGMAVLIIGLFVLGDYMVELDYYDSWYQSAPFWHKSFGMLIVVLLFVRLGLRLYSNRPEELVTNEVERFAARCVHWLLYALMLVICLSGYLISTANGQGVSFFAWFDVGALPQLIENQEDIAGDWHRWLAYALMGLTAIHAMAALKHHFIDHDATLTRMLGKKG